MCDSENDCGDNSDEIDEECGGKKKAILIFFGILRLPKFAPATMVFLARKYLKAPFVASVDE
jgi:hypothetical protein